MSINLNFKIPLWQKIIIGSIIGVIVGLAAPSVAVKAKVLGDIFVRLIQMTIVPLVFPLIVLGIAKLHSGKAVGRMAFKCILYFEIITTFLILMSLGLVQLLGTGKGVNLAGGDASVMARFAKTTVDLQTFLVNIIPKSVVGAAAEGHLLGVLFFGVIFGIALGNVGDKGQFIIKVLEDLSQVMFKVIAYVISFAPIGVFGFLAYSFATYGWSKVTALLDLLIVVYLGLGLAVFVVFPIVCRIFKIPYFSILNYIKDLLLIAASTCNSETVLAPCMQRLENMGVKNSVVSFVLPLGYSFNLDGGSVYWAPAVLFVANAFGMDLSFWQQVNMLLVLMVISKGMAGVMGANFVVLTSVATMFGLPMEGLALVFAIDWISNVARTAVNVIGNTVATVVIAKSEGLIDEERMREVLAQGTPTTT